MWKLYSAQGTIVQQIPNCFEAVGDFVMLEQLPDRENSLPMD